MEHARIEEIISNIHGGSVFSISYVTELPMKAAYKKEGFVCRKSVTKLARTGVEYSHIAGVEPSDSKRVSKVVAVLKNRIYQHSENGTKYVRLAKWSNPHSKVTYFLTYPDGWMRVVEEEDIKEYVIPSYWNRKDGKVPEVVNVKFDNILAIKYAGRCSNEIG